MTVRTPGLHTNEIDPRWGLGGLIFDYGLQGWAIGRRVFNFIEKNRDAGIDEVAKEVKGVL